MKTRLDDNWLVVKLKPNKINIAQKNLRRQNFLFYHPQFLSTIKRKSKFKNVLKPLFPNYMFIFLDDNNQHNYKINNTIGVSHIVRFGNAVPVIKGDTIHKIMASINQDSDNLPSQKFEIGQKIKIKNGPFSNFSGKIEDLSNENRVWILLDWLNNQVRVSIDKFNLI